MAANTEDGEVCVRAAGREASSAQSGWARHYMRHRYRHLDQRLVHALESRTVLRYLRELVRRGNTVLDMPCGYGRFTGPAVRAGLQVTVADRDQGMLDLVRENVGAVPAYRCNSDDLPFENDSFDSAICIRLMQHLRHPEQRRATLNELARVTRSGAVVTVYDHTRLHSLIHDRRKHKKLHRYTRDELRDDLDRAGLRIGRESRPLPGLHAQRVLMLEHR